MCFSDLLEYAMCFSDLLEYDLLEYAMCFSDLLEYAMCFSDLLEYAMCFSDLLREYATRAYPTYRNITDVLKCVITHASCFLAGQDS